MGKWSRFACVNESEYIVPLAVGSGSSLAPHLPANIVGEWVQVHA